MYNNTIANNASPWGGGISNGGVLTLYNTIVANNTIGGNCSGTIVNGGNNIDSDATCGWGSSNDSMSNTDPLLAPLGNNGGSTQTMSLLLGSPAIDMANPSYCPSADQRGFPRFGICDIGAFELQPIEFANKIVNKSNAPSGDSLTYTINLTNGSGTPLTNILVTDTLPIQVTYANGSLTATSGNPSYGSGIITWNGSISTGGSVTLTFGATINASVSAGTIITNSAVIDGAGEIFTRTATTNVVNRFASANKSVNKTVASSGDPLNYTITFTMSNGIEPVTVLVTDTLPSQLSYIPSSLSATSGSPSYSSGVVMWNGTATAGSTVTISFGAKVSQSAPIGTPIVNSAIIVGGGELLTRTVTVNIIAPHLLTFMPMIQKSQSLTGIAGVVTQNGSPVGGIPLLLRFYNGSSWSTRASTSTDPNGYFSFTGVPSLGSGQLYYVLYSNSGTTGLLGFWQTRVLTSYTAGNYVEIGRFDLADITLTAPSPGATVALPYTFQWNTRPATPSDSYEFNLFDPNTGSPWWYTAPLGYVGSYTLTGLPSGFSTNTPYCWAVGVYSPDGGYGMSYWCYVVRFSNAGSKPAPQAPTKPRSAFSDLPRQQFIHKRP